MNKEQLKALVDNKEQLLQEIITSKGFVLDRMKEEEIVPPLEWLLESINVFNIKFISENYKLKSEQWAMLNNFVNNDYSQKSRKSWTDEEVEDALINNIPIGTLALLSVKQINQFTAQIQAQEELDDSEIGHVLRRSLGKMNESEVMGLNQTFLKEYVTLIGEQAHLFHSKEFKEFYKNLIYDLKKKPSINLFISYQFEKEERDFLIKLLDNVKRNSDYGWDSEYEEYSRIRGFTEIIDKYEFFQRYQKNNLTVFTDGEVEKNADFFRSELLKVESIYNRYHPFSYFIKYKMSFQQFKTIVDEGFIENWMKNISDGGKIIDGFIDYFDAEYDHSLVDKRYHLANILLKAFADNKEIKEGVRFRDHVSLYSMLSLYIEIVNEKYSPVHGTESLLPEIKESMKRIFDDVLPRNITNENIQILLNNNERFFGKENLEFTQGFFANNPSINGFILLLNAYQKNSKAYFYNGNHREYMDLLVEKIIVNYHESLLKVEDKKERKSNQNAIHIVLDYFLNTEKLKDDPVLKELLKKTPQSLFASKTEMIESNTNFLNYEKIDLSSIDRELWSTIYEMRPDFKDYIIKNKIEVPLRLLSFCLNQSENDENTRFLAEYVKIHREVISQNEELVNKFLANPRQAEIYPVDNNELYEKSYADIRILIGRIYVTEEKQQILRGYYPNMDIDYSREKTSFPPINLAKFNENMDLPEKMTKTEVKSLFLDFYEKEKSLRKDLEKYKGLLSYGFVTSKMEELLSKRDFQSIELIKEYRLNYNNSVVVNYVNNLNFNDLMTNLDDPSFVKLLKGQLDYDKNTDIKFGSFSYDENMKLATKLLDLYRDKESRSQYGFLYFFKQEDRLFIKEFAINNMPEKIFYGWDFLPEQSQTYKPSNFIVGNYSKEQIYEAFQNMEKREGFFSEMDVNAKFDNFFNYALFPENNRRGRGSKGVSYDTFKDFLDYVKSKDDILYAVLAYARIWEDGLDFGRAYKDEANNAFFNENFDFDQVLRGLDKIIQKMENRRDKYDENSISETVNSKIASYCITAVVHNTYYENYGDNGNIRNGDYNSSTSDEDTLKLMKFLFERAPMHFVERHVFGKAKDPVSYFQQHIDEFYGFEKIKNFLLPNAQVDTEYLRVDDERSEQRKRLLDYTKVIINTAVERKDYQVVGLIKHMVEQHKFLNKELNYRMMNKAYEGVTTMFLDVVAQDPYICAVLEKAKLQMNLDETLTTKEVPVRRRANKI